MSIAARPQEPIEAREANSLDRRFTERRFTSWGRVERRTYRMATPAFRDEVPELLRARADAAILPVGLGRSYGNSNLLADGCLIDMTRLDRIIRFDPEAGILQAEAGLSLSDALTLVVPHGWFLPTTPGTRFVTLGGAVANDVHGKNHHRAGSFGCSVRRLGLVRSDDQALEISATQHPALFAATIGGLGLTGVVTWVELALARIPGTTLQCERRAFSNVHDFFGLAREAEERFEHTAAWIDCVNGDRALGRGIFEAANWSATDERKLHRPSTRHTVPFDAPCSVINPSTVRIFNTLYYNLKRVGAREYRQHYAPYFYPLDAIGHWNRLYGRRGFYQYQSVVPPAAAEEATKAMLERIAKAGMGSFLAVLKTFGSRRSPGLLSFPREGATLALDFPNSGKKTLALLADLDLIVRQAGGRLYPAKDGRMPADLFAVGYPRLGEFRRYVDPAFSSDLWRQVNA